ncbi:MAG: TRAP transporter substrate-binding protein [Bacteroidota bacterium]
MNRKDFFKGLAVGTVALPIAIRSISGDLNAQQNNASTASISGQVHRWKMVTTWPPNFPVLGEGCKLFADLVQQMSNGRIQIKVFGGGELVPPLECFDAVRSGAADLAHGCAYYWAGKVPAAQFFASVPFGMNAQQMNGWILNGDGWKLWRELYAEYNLVPFPAGNTGVQMGGWFNRKIDSLADMQGLKMRMPGLGSKVLERAGATPVLLAGSEIYTGLERGVIDATEWIGPYHDYKMGFHQIAKYYYTPGWHEPGTMLEIFINKDKYEALSPDLQAIVRTASLWVNSWMLGEGERRNAEYLQVLKAETEVEILRFPQAVLEQLRTYTHEVLEEMVADDPTAKKVYASFQAYRQQISAWAALTEQVFYQDIQELS